MGTLYNIFDINQSAFWLYTKLVPKHFWRKRKNWKRPNETSDITVIEQNKLPFRCDFEKSTPRILKKPITKSTLKSRSI